MVGPVERLGGGGADLADDEEAGVLGGDEEQKIAKGQVTEWAPTRYEATKVLLSRFAERGVMAKEIVERGDAIRLTGTRSEVLDHESKAQL